MAFSDIQTVGGQSIIIQSGTDDDLSGLAPITGITTVVVGEFTDYYIQANTRLSIQGVLSIDPSIERLHISQAADPPAGLNSADVTGGSMVCVGEISGVDTANIHAVQAVGNTGALRIGSTSTINGDTFIESGGYGIIIGGSYDIDSTKRPWHFRGLRVTPGSRFQLIDSSIQSKWSVRFDASATGTFAVPDVKGFDGAASQSAATFTPDILTGYTDTYDLSSTGVKSAAIEVIGACQILITAFDSQFNRDQRMDLFAGGSFVAEEGSLSIASSGQQVEYQLLQPFYGLRNLVSKHTTGYTTNQAATIGLGLLDIDFISPSFRGQEANTSAAILSGVGVSDVGIRSSLATDNTDWHNYRLYSPGWNTRRTGVLQNTSAGSIAAQGSMERYINVNRTIQTVDSEELAGIDYLAIQDAPDSSNSVSGSSPLRADQISIYETSATTLNNAVLTNSQQSDYIFGKRWVGQTDTNGQVLTVIADTLGSSDAGADGVNILVETFSQAEPSGGAQYNTPDTREFYRQYGWLQSTNTIASGTFTDISSPVFLSHDPELTTRSGTTLTFLPGLNFADISSLDGDTQFNLDQMYAGIALIHSEFSTVTYPTTNGTTLVLDDVDEVALEGVGVDFITWSGTTSMNLAGTGNLELTGTLDGLTLTNAASEIIYPTNESIGLNLTATTVSQVTYNAILIDGGDVNGTMVLPDGSYEVRNTDLSGLTINAETNGVVTIQLTETSTGTLAGTGTGVTLLQVPADPIVRTFQIPLADRSLGGTFAVKNVVTGMNIVPNVVVDPSDSATYEFTITDGTDTSVYNPVTDRIQIYWRPGTTDSAAYNTTLVAINGAITEGGTIPLASQRVPAVLWENIVEGQNTGVAMAIFSDSGTTTFDLGGFHRFRLGYLNSGGQLNDSASGAFQTLLVTFLSTNGLTYTSFLVDNDLETDVITSAGNEAIVDARFVYIDSQDNSTQTITAVTASDDSDAATLNTATRSLSGGGTTFAVTILSNPLGATAGEIAAAVTAAIGPGVDASNVARGVGYLVSNGTETSTAGSKLLGLKPKSNDYTQGTSYEDNL